MKKGKRYKNYCNCERRGGVIYRNRDCIAKYVHNGKKTVIIHDMEALNYER